MVHATTFVASAAALFSMAMANQKYTGQVVLYADGDFAQRMDPILAPGTISQHVHQFLGSSAAAPDATYDSLQNTNCTTVGAGQGIKVDNSMYWYPALYMEAKNGSGYVKVPTAGNKLYYKDAGTGKMADPFEFPKGFRMLAGNPFIRAAASNVHAQNITQWICHLPNYHNNQGTDGGFPDVADGCPDSPYFNGALHFPHCWNGHDFDPANPTAHMSYPDGDVQEGTCPDTHNIRLPHIFMENAFNINAVLDVVKPNSFVLAQGDNTGYGMHADFLNGWEEGALPNMFAACTATHALYSIADCSGGFPKNGYGTGSCDIPITYDENVQNPAPFLPGCNPIVNTNPAPIMQIATELGANTLDCLPIGGAAQAAPVQSAASSAAGYAASSAAGYAASSASASAPSSAAPVYSAPASSSVAASSPAPSSSASASSSAAPPSGTASAATLDCPGDDGKTFTSNGKTFQIECGIDHVAGNLDMLYANNLTACIGACASHSDCVDVSLSGTACWMKKTLGKAVNRGEVSGARLLTGGSSSSPSESAVSSSETLLTTTTVVPTHTAGMPAGQTVWVTEEVTVTAYQPVYTHKARDEEAVKAHMHQHAKYHVGRRAF